MRPLLFFLLLATSALSSCKKSTSGSEVTATIGGVSWASERVVSTLNDSGDVTKIEAFASDNTRLIFRIEDTQLLLSDDDFPEDLFGVSLASSVTLTASPSLHDISYTLEVLQPSSELTSVEVLISGDQTNFSPLSSSLVESAPFTKSWVSPNIRSSNNDYQLLKVRMEYGQGLAWESDVALGWTSFRAQYDGGLTSNEVTGDFIVRSLDRNNSKLSADFDFVTSSVEVANGKIEELAY